jgi:hypothetical protein
MSQEPEIEELKSQLLNKQRLSGEYLLAWGKIYKKLRETGIDDALGVDKDPSTYIKTLPLELEANLEALLQLLVRNNERILRLLELTLNKPV